jgi:hypothetical protein
MSKPGRPRRTELPDGIGLFSDDAVGFAAGMSDENVRRIRNQHDIPPASEPHRSRWYERKGRVYEPLEGDF